MGYMNPYTASKKQKKLKAKIKAREKRLKSNQNIPNYLKIH
jgi:hypothetical protein